MTARRFLCLSTAILCAAVAVPAFAQDATDIAKKKAYEVATERVLESETGREIAKDVALEKARSRVFGGEAQSTTDIVKDKALDSAKTNIQTMIDKRVGEPAETPATRKRYDADTLQEVTDMIANERAQSAVRNSETRALKEKAMKIGKDQTKVEERRRTRIRILSGQSDSAPALDTTAPVNCPSGTTAQPDGTCMITGDWSGN